MIRLNESWVYRAGMAIALLASFLIMWTTVVRDDGTGMSYFPTIMTGMVGGFAAWFRPAGMARAMLGVAMMQALLGIALATAPSTVSLPGGPPKALIFSAFFAGLWLISAAFFRMASKRNDGPAEAH